MEAGPGGRGDAGRGDAGKGGDSRASQSLPSFPPLFPRHQLHAETDGYRQIGIYPATRGGV